MRISIKSLTATASGGGYKITDELSNIEEVRVPYPSSDADILNAVVAHMEGNMVDPGDYDFENLNTALDLPGVFGYINFYTGKPLYQIINLDL